MWKWLAGCLVVLVVLIAAGSWWGYQAMQSNLSPDGTERVTIAGTPARVYSALANGDSVVKWMAQGNAVSTSRHGSLVVGDSLLVAVPSTVGMPNTPMVWQVIQIIPDRLLALALVGDKNHQQVAIRRDSLAAAGDSTRVLSTIGSPMFDSLKTVNPASRGKAASGALDMSSKLVIAAFRMQSRLDLLRLKAHIENSPMPTPR